MRARDPQPTLRRAVQGDVEGIAAVAVASGQTGPDSAAEPRYVEHLLAHGDVVAAADDAGRVLGFGATRRIGPASHLTDLFVAEAARGRGIGRAILEELWPEREAARTTFSSQHPSALPLYASFGLQPLWPLLYLRGASAALDPSAAEARRVPWQEAAALERLLTGVDRAVEHRYWSSVRRGAAVVIALAGEQIGAAAVSPDAVVHLACSPPSLATDALVAALHALEESEARLCLPGPHPALPLLLRSGFTIDEYDIYMSSDAALVPGWSIPSPGLG